MVAIEEHDPVFNCDEAKSRVKDIFGVKKFHDVKIIILHPHFHGKLCRIWDFLVQEAASLACSYFGEKFLSRLVKKAFLSHGFSRYHINRRMGRNIGSYSKGLVICSIPFLLSSLKLLDALSS
jgi:hypothetical protein